VSEERYSCAKKPPHVDELVTEERFNRQKGVIEKERAVTQLNANGILWNLKTLLRARIFGMLSFNSFFHTCRHVGIATSPSIILTISCWPAG
jgi:hypothetical protein